MAAQDRRIDVQRPHFNFRRERDEGVSYLQFLRIIQH
jgi:hypothetical protein